VKGTSVDRLLRNIGRRVGEVRRVRRVTQEQLAERVGLSPRYIQQIESGHGNPSIRALCEIAAQLRVEFAELLTPASNERARPGRPRTKRREG
jgi:XRE family transcriptional regulator, aerobic/anaerobic benzoate catabolism transcriptional regulator